MSLSEPAQALLRVAEHGSVARAMRRDSAAPIALSLTSDMAAIAETWREFETVADCTVFQAYAWQSAWLRNIAPHERTVPAVVSGRAPDGALLFIMPFAVERKWFARRLVWLAADFCDYNGPLLAPDFSARVSPERFVSLWRGVVALLRSRPDTRFDVAVLDKLPETIGGQPNPFRALGGQLNANGAHMMALGSDWESFYRAKRSSATRRHDRAKRKRLAEFGEVRFVTPADPRDTIETLFVQKARSLARQGIANFFARPGVANFFRDLVAYADGANIAHVSRLDVGDTAAATNLGLIFRDRYYHVLTAYEGGELARYAPGTAHLHELIRHAIDRGCRTFDFTVGDQDFKRNWCEIETRLYDVRRAVTPLGWPVLAASFVYGRAKRLVKRTPALWRVFSALRAGAARLAGLADGPADCGAEKA